MSGVEQVKGVKTWAAWRGVMSSDAPYRLFSLSMWGLAREKGLEADLLLKFTLVRKQGEAPVFLIRLLGVEVNLNLHCMQKCGVTCRRYVGRGVTV